MTKRLITMDATIFSTMNILASMTIYVFNKTFLNVDCADSVAAQGGGLLMTHNKSESIHQSINYNHIFST